MTCLRNAFKWHTEDLYHYPSSLQNFPLKRVIDKKGGKKARKNKKRKKKKGDKSDGEKKERRQKG